jgi:hypothetical protein
MVTRPAFAQHAGDDRVHRPLAAARLVRVAFGQGEARAAVLEVDAELCGRQPEPKLWKIE